jgi:hypothetical protein
VTFRPRNALVWFAVGGGAGAYVVQFVAGLAFTFAQCNQRTARFQLPVESWQVGLAIAGAAVSLVAMGTSVWLFLRTYRVDDVFRHETRGDGSAPPIGRVQFLAIVGLVVNFLVLAIMVMDASAAPNLSLCQQS